MEVRMEVSYCFLFNSEVKAASSFPEERLQKELDFWLKCSRKPFTALISTVVIRTRDSQYVAAE